MTDARPEIETGDPSGSLAIEYTRKHQESFGSGGLICVMRLVA